jgi:hypothetical protein
VGTGCVLASGETFAAYPVARGVTSGRNRSPPTLWHYSCGSTSLAIAASDIATTPSVQPVINHIRSIHNQLMSLALPLSSELPCHLS